MSTRDELQELLTKEPLIPMSEAARRLGISRQRAYQLRDKGRVYINQSAKVSMSAPLPENYSAILDTILNERLTQPVVAERFGISMAMVYRILLDRLINGPRDGGA